MQRFFFEYQLFEVFLLLFILGKQGIPFFLECSLIFLVGLLVLQQNGFFVLQLLDL